MRSEVTENVSVSEKKVTYIILFNKPGTFVLIPVSRGCPDTSKYYGEVVLRNRKTLQ
jgi:hypothetical protein